jgi:hypothetical protein
MKYLLLLFTVTFHGQVLHHQMISSQADSKTLSNGIVIQQTIGQQSITGSSVNGFSVQQGFQQNSWTEYVLLNDFIKIRTTTYPNPFIRTINFEFSEVMNRMVEVSIYDFLGHLVFKKEQMVTDTLMTLNLDLVTGQEFLVKLSAVNFVHYTKIIKKQLK